MPRPWHLYHQCDPHVLELVVLQDDHEHDVGQMDFILFERHAVEQRQHVHLAPGLLVLTA
eukprot:1565209-Amphidinium_carterae.2